MHLGRMAESGRGLDSSCPDNGHSPISLLHLSFNSYPALCDEGYQFLVVLSEVFVLDTSALVISHLHRVEDYGLLPTLLLLLRWTLTRRLEPAAKDLSWSFAAALWAPL